MHFLTLTCTRLHTIAVFLDEVGAYVLLDVLLKSVPRAQEELSWCGRAALSALPARLPSQKPGCIPALALGCQSQDPPWRAGDKPSSFGWPRPCIPRTSQSPGAKGRTRKTPAPQSPAPHPSAPHRCGDGGRRSMCAARIGHCLLLPKWPCD